MGSVESLRNDYLVIIMRSKRLRNKGVSRERRKHEPKLKTFARRITTTFLEANPAVSLRIEKILLRLPRLPGILGRAEILPLRLVLRPLVVFDDIGELTTFLRQVKEKNTGASVVVTGLFQDVNLCLKRLGLCPHTVQFSLGVFGRVGMLPRKEVLEITTMCGHHLISPRLVEKLVTDVSNKRIDAGRAAKMCGKLCVCKAFNETRATDLIEDLALKLRIESKDRGHREN